MAFIFLLGVIGVFAALIWLAVALIRKKPRKTPVRMLVLTSFITIVSLSFNEAASLLGWLVLSSLVACLLIYWIWKDKRQISVNEPPTTSVPSSVSPAAGTPPVARPKTDWERDGKEVADLKRAGRYSEALVLLDHSMEETERLARGSGPLLRSWPYQQAAIIYRKQKDYDGEIAVLERFARQPNSGSKQSRTLMKRLAKAYVLAGEAGDVADAERMPLLVAQAVLIDCETTGFSRRDEIIDLALLVFEYSRATGEVLGIVEQYVGLREPRLSIPPDATAVHGLTDSDVRGQGLDEGKCRSLFDVADVLVAHNVGFDRRMVAALFPEVQSKTWLCSMNGVKWKAKGHSSKALQSLLSDFEIVPDTAHRALADAQATLQLISQVDPDTGDTYFAEMLDRPAGNSR